MKQNLYGGRFIVLEGLNGSGKSEQARRLKKHFAERGLPVFLTKEPTQRTGAGKKIKDILEGREQAAPLKLQELFAQDRSEHLEEEVIPMLREGKIVVSDRYAFSSVAFGSIDVPLRKLLSLNDDFLCPDKVVLLRVDPEECLRRINGRGTNIRIFEKLEKMRKVAANYEMLARSKRFSKAFAVVDGEKSAEAVHQEILAVL
ncbi:MAG: dTMP kinase [Candidatus Portnoybacteria bacterium]|nr:dTMP kinase [Candidatus Portnoybacteria bacterium]MDD4982916.1 dTMP kinase [Candidatus Portnoybacteria bacterium]